MVGSLLTLVLAYPLGSAAALQLDFHKSSPVHRSLARRGHAEVPLLENALHIEYFINVSVGSPPQVSSSAQGLTDKQLTIEPASAAPVRHRKQRCLVPLSVL
jgi:hypothetical protein